MSPKSAVSVCIRTRPTSNIAKDLIEIDSGARSVDITMKKRRDEDYVSNQPDKWHFAFDNILHNAGQENVYEVCGHDLAKGLIEGINGTVMAYGQTGAGKTFTMLGPGTDSFKYRGLIPRVLTDIFKEIGNRPQTSFVVRCSYLEIYQDQLYDLLEVDRTQNLMIVEDEGGNIVVKGLSKHVIESEEDALRLLFLGETRRKVAEHQYNKNSSRSHCVFTLYTEATSRVESNARVTVSKLNLVDLAGSERVKKSQSVGETLRESKFINKSLSFLEQVVIALAQKKKREHIPYRQSRLTNVLKDTLGANAKIVLIANVFVEAIHLEETLSTLKFASRMMLVEQEASINVTEDAEMKVKRHERAIAELKSELAMHDALVSRSHIAYDPYTEEQRYELGKTVRAYAYGEIDEIELSSVRHMKEILLQFRQLVQNLNAELASKNMSANASVAANAMVSQPNRKEAVQSGQDESTAVGTLQGGGFGVGLAPSGARPKAIAGTAKDRERGEREKERERERERERNQTPDRDRDRDVVATPVGVGKARGGNAAVTGTSATVNTVSTPTPATPGEGGGEGVSGLDDDAQQQPAEAYKSRDEAFEDFKVDPNTVGPHITSQLTEQKRVLKDGKELVKKLVVEVNKEKKRIDELSMLLGNKKQERTMSLSPTLPGVEGQGDDEVIDEEEFEALKEQRMVKKRYRAKFDELSSLKRENSQIQSLIDELRHKLVEEFEMWYAATYPPPALSGLNALAAGSSTQPSTTGDVMDYGEVFDNLELQRIVEEDPESSAFFAARKNVTKGAKSGRGAKGHGQAKGRRGRGKTRR